MTDLWGPKKEGACPCGVGDSLEACCGPLLAGAAAPTAEALMRSRYTAYVLERYEYLGETDAEALREKFDRDETAAMVEGITWTGLKVVRTKEGGPEDETGEVEFLARFRHQGKDLIRHEASTFQRENGRWVYVDSVMNPKHPPRQVEQIGRNDPCPCGSGKKYKKCCGK
ncbi:YchJ family metal-binding protein [Pararhodospirillum oryzae]|uniref:YchJ-like middle NTF2-like domain-containing protein n=1 Tax=Pararhodospirillum oryzae TaxID=478448 RepID=A0A512HBX7_9PROT|nr:YchJ family metal-binding protein [Pararhodospirillum oryzae]GEO82953.1 hypothetical protein ROR02_30840 [Pararhodospirillum oryzae]